jgi:hypothetical protein
MAEAKYKEVQGILVFREGYAGKHTETGIRPTSFKTADLPQAAGLS